MRKKKLAEFSDILPNFDQKFFAQNWPKWKFHYSKLFFMDLRFRNWTYKQTSFWLKNRHATSSNKARCNCHIFVNLISSAVIKIMTKWKNFFIKIKRYLKASYWQEKVSDLFIIVTTAKINLILKITANTSSLTWRVARWFLSRKLICKFHS